MNVPARARPLCMVLAAAVTACGVHTPADTPAVGQQVRADRAALARGAQSFSEHGCGACHHRSDSPGARGVTGPPLDDLDKRVYVAGHLPNQPETLARFIVRPQDIDPASAMPTTGVSLEDARAIALFLQRPR